jgi:Fe-S cluster biogenesis protein NfuA
VTIPLHAERVANDAHAVRWVVPAGRLPAGHVRSAPGRLGELFADGTLSAGLTENSAVWLWLREGLSWSGKGTEVRAALQDALGDPQAWSVEPDPGEVLERVTTDLLDGPVGDFVRSHGGTVSTQRCGATVTVQLGGACEHCPAAGLTLRQRLVGELRDRCPDLVEVDSGGRRLTLTLA